MRKSPRLRGVSVIVFIPIQRPIKQKTTNRGENRKIAVIDCHSIIWYHYTNGRARRRKEN